MESEKVESIEKFDIISFQVRDSEDKLIATVYDIELARFIRDNYGLVGVKIIKLTNFF